MPDVFRFVSQDVIQSAFATSAVLLISVYCLLHWKGKVVVSHWTPLSKQTVGRSDSALDRPEFRIKFNKQLDESRVSVLVGARACALVLCPIICCDHLLIRQAAPPDTRDVFGAPSAVLGLYFILSLVSATVNRSPTAGDCRKLYAVVTLLLSILVSYTSAEHLGIFFSSVYRHIMLVRLVLALSVLDAPRVMCLTPILSCVTCCTYARYLDRMLSEGQRGDYSAHLAHFVMFELCTIIVFGIFLWSFESIVRSSVRSSVESEITERVQQARIRLLSLLCDAQVHLSANLVVLEHSGSLPGLLMASPGAGPSSLHGSPFVERIAEVDLPRFHNFLSSTPALIHLSLKRNGGDTVPVDLFCVRLEDDTDEPGYFIGIKAGSTDGTSDVPDATDESAQSLPRVELDEDNMPSVSEVSSVSEESSVSESKLLTGEASGNCQVEYDTISSAASAMGYSNLVHSVGMSLDVLGGNFDIREMTLQLAQEKSSADPDGTPIPPRSLLDWLPNSQAPDTMSWLQQTANAMLSSDDETPEHGPLQLVCGQDIFLAAERVEAESFDAPRIADGTITLKLRLRGISRFVWPPWAQQRAMCAWRWEQAERKERRKRRSARRRPGSGLAAITESIPEEARGHQVLREGEPPMREAGWPQRRPTDRPSSAPF